MRHAGCKVAAVVLPITRFHNFHAGYSRQAANVRTSTALRSQTGWILHLYVPYYNLRATLDEKATDITITEWGNYYVTVQFAKAGMYQLEIFGYQYSVIKTNATKTLHLRGKTVTWENPLISDSVMAKDLAEWLGDYYQSGIEYEYTTRGNPELDVDDIIHQENVLKIPT